MAILGIRREDKSEWERRVPLVPQDVARLVREEGIEILVQPSRKRCFPDSEFAAAGAVLTDDLAEARVILGVKEVPPEELEARKAYLFFSHTIKGQPYNMPMLRRILDLSCTLMDYELVADANGVRTIAFGRHAGLAAAIDTLWILGKRLAAEGIPTPLEGIHPAIEYGEVSAALPDLERAGAELAASGTPAGLGPIVLGVTGEGGKVFGGAMEVFERLPHVDVAPDHLNEALRRGELSGREVVLVRFGPEHLVERTTPGAYSFEHYVDHPGEYRSSFGRHLPNLTAIVHGIFWAEGYPRFILREDLARLWRADSPPRLRVITDVTCDLDGSNESLVKVTDPGAPAYVFDPSTGRDSPGVEGRGPVVLAVDILPAEIPREASRHFSEALTPLVPALARCELRPGAPGLHRGLEGSLIAVDGALVSPWDEELAEPLALHGGGEPSDREAGEAEAGRGRPGNAAPGEVAS